MLGTFNNFFMRSWWGTLSNALVNSITASSSWMVSPLCTLLKYEQCCRVCIVVGGTTNKVVIHKIDLYGIRVDSREEQYLEFN